MRYWIGPFLGLTLALIGWAKADPLDDAMEWVAENSRFEYVDNPPKIVPVSEEDWERNGWFMYWAVYDKGFLYIPDWQEVPPETWAHEAVHHYQWLAGEMPIGYCPGELEPEAYRLEREWMEAHGYDPPPHDTAAMLWTTVCEPRR